VNAEAPDVRASRRAIDGRILAVLAVGALLFGLLATLNAGGYRYGAGDQAAYVPLILRHLDGRLFPRDGVLLDAQDRLFVFDDLMGRAVALTPVPLEVWFAALYVVTLLILYAGLVRLGTSLLVSRWSVAAFVVVSAVRHRIAKTGANTLEGYFHPRQLAFAIGVIGLGEVLRQRPWTALGAAVIAGVVHPTTGIWFLAWIGVALFVERPSLRLVLGAAGGLAVAAGVGLLAGRFLSTDRMDDAWVATLAGKDYLFANQWGAAPWILNALYPVVIGVTVLARRDRGLLRAGELGLAAGCLALVAVFFLTLPLVAARVAFAVQFQISRVFWMADLLALLYVVWWIAEAARVAQAGAALRPGRRPMVACLVLAAFALVRGSYVLYVEHPGRPLMALRAPDDAWSDVNAFLRDDTPPTTHVLADPDHAMLFGTSVRVLAARDVFLENQKDEAISMYDRRTAQRVAERRVALGDFGRRTAPELQALAHRYALDVVVSERDLSLPELYRNARFRVYRLTP
jgi:hypothetical protein